jgi:23S rRNA-/tRNA-specific pseudouridylate synthase
MNATGNVGKLIKAARSEYLLFRNKEYVAINKPIGLLLKAGKEPVSEVRKLFENVGIFGEGGSTPIPVTDMDSSMSGVAVFSLNASAGRLARNMLKGGKFWRCHYWGLVEGRIAGGHSEGVISIPLKDGLPDSDGLPSITHWKLLKFHGQRGSSDGISLIRFEPRTCATDQIRIHCEQSLKCRLMEGIGLHLYQVSGCFPGGDHTSIVAPPKGLFSDKLAHLGFM